MSKPSIRDLLLDLGIGGFNATMIIPYMLIAPATTDPKAGQIILLVQAIQRRLYQMGATDVPESGELDAPTASAIQQLCGPNWLRMQWSAVVSAVNDAKRSYLHLLPMRQVEETGGPIAVSGPLDFLPDVPGGLLTYAVGSYFLWRYLTKRSPRA